MSQAPHSDKLTAVEKSVTNVDRGTRNNKSSATHEVRTIARLDCDEVDVFGSDLYADGTRQ